MAYFHGIKLQNIYSGDANNINEIILNKLKSGEIDFMYQDTCGLDYKGNNHLSLKRLCELIPKDLRNKVYCMHLDKHILKEEINSAGFNVTFNETLLASEYSK